MPNNELLMVRSRRVTTVMSHVSGMDGLYVATLAGVMDRRQRNRFVRVARRLVAAHAASHAKAGGVVHFRHDAGGRVIWRSPKAGWGA